MISHSTLPEDQLAIRARCFHPTGTFAEFPREALVHSLVDRFEEQVSLHADRLSVKSGPDELTYAELNVEANRVAYGVVKESGTKQETVALLFEHGVSAIIATLGVLKAGKTFVPMDTHHPLARLQYIVENCETRLIVTDNKNAEAADALAGGRLGVISIDDLDSTTLDENRRVPVSPDDAAFLVYTSGSTGRPKGVVQSHRNLVHAIRSYVNALRLCPQDRLSMLYSYSVGGGIRDTFRGLLNGTSLHIWNIRKQGMIGFPDWLVRDRVTVYNSVIPVFREFVAVLHGDEAFPDLRLIVVGGESIYSTDVDLYKKHFSPDCIFIDRYGPMETETVSMYLVNKQSQIDGVRVPIGHPTEDTEVAVLDDQREPVAQGEVGEVAIRSRYLSTGYWRMPELTHQRFLPDEEDPRYRTYLTGDLGQIDAKGRTVVLGRKDTKTNIRGYLVDLSEIEGALLGIKNIQAAAVVMKGKRREDERLVAYVVTTRQTLLNITEIRRSLSEALPSQMIPASFVAMESLPVLATGKVDRMALPEPEKARPDLDVEFVAPRTGIEDDLTKIWSDVLDLIQIGVHDNFLDLGGDSLKATRIVTRVVKRFGVEVALGSLFDSPTIADMTVVVTNHLVTNAADKDDIASLFAELEAMTDEQARRLVDDASETSSG